MAGHLVDDESNKDVGVGKRLRLLEGIKVLDLTRALAGPYGAMVLADSGAEVIKVEQLTGDTTRNDRGYLFGGDGSYFISINRNKQSIALDIRTEKGHEILARLIEQSDIVMDNLRAPQRERLGLSFEALQQINPMIVSCSITGFGSDGPYADRPGYDIVVEAMAGVMSITGPEGGPSVRAGVPIGDIVGGMYATIGALEGLEYRRRNGHGTHIDISLLDCQISLLSYLAQYYFTNGYVATHQGRAHVSNPLYIALETKDGEIAMNAGQQEPFVALCSAIHREDLVTDVRFTDYKLRLANRVDLRQILEEEFRKLPTQELYEALIAGEVAAGPVNTIEQALHDPQVRHRNMIVKVPHRSGEDFLTIGTPIHTDAIGEDFVTPPAIGGDTYRILRELEYSDAEIQELSDTNVIRLDDSAAPLSGARAEADDRIVIVPLLRGDLFGSTGSSAKGRPGL